VTLDGVRVGPDALVGGEPGGGYRTALACLAHGRLHIAALCVGLAARLVEESLAWSIERRQGGRPIAEHQLVAAMLADSQTELMAGRALVRDAARAYDAGIDTRLAPACAKLYCSEMVGRVADRAVQVHGGAGYMRGVPVERFYRDARLFRIYEGTSQIQQLVIAAELIRGRA
jgi:acyl-CoA dehydrogenase